MRFGGKRRSTHGMTDLNMDMSIIGDSPSFCMILSTKPGLGAAGPGVFVFLPSIPPSMSSRAKVEAFRRGPPGGASPCDWKEEEDDDEAS